jgi:dipeptidase D
MANPLAGHEPAELWKWFYEITRIPRESKNESRIRAWLQNWAADHGCQSRVDAAGNIVIQVNASPQCESAPVAVVQGHMDMVCEKNSDVQFDFETDPIDVYVDGDWVKARGTTLGADNGIGIAAGLAAVTDPAIVHGPLELLFTVDEETGLTGAVKLEPDMLQGRILLNCDSEEDGTLYVGCAGGGDNVTTLRVKRTKPPARKHAYRVKVTGLKGGHSGLNIHENRANAVKLLARFLDRAMATIRGKVYPTAVHGGDKHNAIPREAWADFYASNRAAAALRRLAKTLKEDALTEFRTIDPDIDIVIEDAPEEPVDIIHRKDASKLVNLLLAIPHGVEAMSRDIEGLVETSNNLASVKTDGEVVTILTSSRSSVMPALEAHRRQVAAVGELAGAEVEAHGGYPAWQPDMESKLLAMTKQTYADRFGREPHVTAIHAGLECGIIGDKFPGMEMISFGPNITGAHSPDEAVQISTTVNFYKLFAALLEKISRMKA